MRHIAEAKRKENIVEYLLYLWQMEDLLRGVALDVQMLDAHVFSTISDEELRAESKAWFTLMARELKAQNAEKSGHTAESAEIISELALLQHTLLTVLANDTFRKIYAEAVPLLTEFRGISDKLPKSDVETALTALYGALVLRLAGKGISPETKKALDVFSAFLRYLAGAYRDMKSGQLPMNN